MPPRYMRGPNIWTHYLQRSALPPSLGIDLQQTPSRCSCCFQYQIHPRDFRSLTSAYAKTSSFLPLVFPPNPKRTVPNTLKTLTNPICSSPLFCPACWESCSPEMREALQCSRDAERRSWTLPYFLQSPMKQLHRSKPSGQRFVVNEWQQHEW